MQPRPRKTEIDKEIFEQLMVSETAKMQMPDGTSISEGAMHLLDHVEIGDIARKPDELVYLRLTYLLIGSAYSFVAFQQTIRAARKNILLNTHLSSPNPSSAEYLQTIEALSMTEASCSMLKRYCIVKVFAPELESLGPTDSIFEFETPQTSVKKPIRSAGNPVYKKKAVITNAMMKKLYPGLAAGPQFESKRRFVTKLRKQAKRLHMLTAKFGLGVLAFIPTESHLLNWHTSDNR